MEGKTLKYMIDKYLLDDFEELEFNEYKVLYKDKGEGSGFIFYSFEWVGSPVDSKRWADDVEVEHLFFGIAHFDGIRHLHMGSKETDNIGYFNYPNSKILIEIMVFLKKLEDKYCVKL